MSARLPFYLKHSTVGLAVERGIYFELCYSAAIRGKEPHDKVFGANAVSLERKVLILALCLFHVGIIDATARRNLISNAQSLIRVTRGKNIILSSQAMKAMELRGPYDIVNL